MNPVADGLVAKPSSWPGVRFLPEDFGTTITVRKPDEAFFGGRRPQGWVPTYPPARRALLASRRRAEQERRRRQNARDRARGRGRRRGRQLARKRRRKEAASPPPRPPRESLPDEVTVTISRPPGYDHMTLDEVRAHFRTLLDERVASIHAEREAEGLTHFMGVEAILAQNPFESAGGTFPSFARTPRIAGRGSKGHKALLRDLQEWRQQYRAALALWREGRRDAVFPWGSYWLPRFHGARVASATGPPLLLAG